MGIVAPLSAVLTALVPVGYSAFYSGLPSMAQLAGFICFMVAIWLLSAGDAGFKMTLNELFLSIIAGLGFGLFFILIDRANDVAGNLFFSVAAHLGRLDISAVLGSLYPAATVFLAWFFLKERLGRKQWVGGVCAFVALILISV